MISLFGFSYCDSCVFCMKQEVNLKEILLIVLFLPQKKKKLLLLFRIIYVRVIEWRILFLFLI